MITQQEIKTLANKHKLNPNMIEKDYVLGWMLVGINQNTTLSKKWIFKGGTCLKKSYFKDYRFSEDLDFTLTKNASVSVDEIKKCLNDVKQWIYEESGIEITIANLTQYKNEKRELIPTFVGKIEYRGPLVTSGSLPRIKLDLTQEENLESAPQKLTVYHEYSDYIDNSFKAYSYSFEEIFSEKTRALFERCRPRDLYDVINLHERRAKYNFKENEYCKILDKKFQFKGMNLKAEIHQDLDDTELRNEWDNMLKEQIYDLPTVDDYLGRLQNNVLPWLKNLITRYHVDS